MAGFNLTAQLQLQAPSNTSKVVGDIKKQLSGITANIQVKGDAGSLAKINKQMQGVSKSANASSKAVGSLNRNLSEAARRFSVITVATGTMLSLARAIKNSVGEAIAFERELVKISQVTGKTVQNLQGLTKEVTKLSTSWGASSKELLNVSRVLAQAGFSAEKTRQALDILAKTSLGATFDSLADTTEGAIAVLRQFRNEAKAAGGDIKFLEQTMDAINSVSKSFAVESGDLITVIRRVGGVFESAGGSVNELIALFTSVRATTRESAETISTGLRTIFTRIQRTDTVDQLAALGIQLRDAQGQFVGAFEAVKRLSQGLSALDPRDFRFSEIVESLGGFRQIGKVIPLIRQFTVAQDALNVAQSSSGSVTRDAVIAQQSLAVQAQKVRQEFDALVRKLTDSSAFRSVAQGALEMARAFIRIVDALEPLLPLLTGLIALKIGRSLAPGIGAIAGIKKKAEGGRIHKFARGGFVPGTGNRDTVPAMLQPGEFVIRKSSASKLGGSTLEAMNNNRFREGGRSSGRMAKRAQDKRRGDVEFGGSTSLSKNKKLIGELNTVTNKIDQIKTDNVYGGAFLRHSGSGSIDLKGQIEKTQLVNSLKANKTYMAMSSAKGGSEFKNLAEDLKRRATEPKDLEFMLKARSLKKGISEKAESKLYDGVLKSVGKTGKFLQRETGAGPPTATMDEILSNTNIDNVIGNLFEASVLEAGAPYNPKDRDAANAPFDFPKGLGGVHSAFVDGAAIKQAISDAKTSMTTGNIRSFIKKAKNQKLAEYTKKMDALLDGMPNIKAEFGTRGPKASERGTHIGALEDRLGRKRKAMGGKIDSVPALLTPGEFVVNKSSAQSIGYGNLNKMNQTGVQRFAAGGAVNTRRHAYGNGLANRSFNPVEVTRADGSRVGGAELLPALKSLTKETRILSTVTRSTTKPTKPPSPPAAAPPPSSFPPRSRVHIEGPAPPPRKPSPGPPGSTWAHPAPSGPQPFIGPPNRPPSFKDPFKAVGRGLGKVGTEAKKASGAAQSAQNIAFMGAAAISTAVQLSNLSDSTKQAVTETVAFAGGLLGAGSTAIQMLSGLSMISKTAAVSEGVETVANAKSTATEEFEANANLKSAASENVGMGGATKAMLGIGAAAAIVATVFKGFAASARANADQIKKSTDKLISDLEGGKGGDASAIKSSVASGMAARGEAAAFDKASVAGGAAAVGFGLTGMLAAGAAGAAMGSAVPIIGTLVGAIAGATIGYFVYKSAQDEAIAAQKEQIAALNNSIDSYVNTVKSLNTFNQTLADIDVEKNLKPDERIQRRIAATTQLSDGSGADDLGTQQSQLAGLAEQLKKPISALTEADFEDMPVALEQFKFATSGTTKTLEALSLANKTARQTLNEASKEALTGEFSIDELKQQVDSGGASQATKNYVAALNAAEAAIKAESQAAIAVKEAEINSIKASTTAKLEAKEIDQKTADAQFAAANAMQSEVEQMRQREVQQQKDLITGQNNAIDGLAEETRAHRIAAAAALELSQKMREVNAAMAGLRGIAASQEKDARGIAGRAALDTNSDLDFSNTAIQGLDDITQIDDVKKFDAEMGALINELPEGMRGQFTKMLDNVKHVNEVFTSGKERVTKNFASGLSEGALGEPKQNEIIKEAIGEDAFAGLSDAMRTQMQEQIRTLGAETGGITSEDFDKIFGPFLQEGQEAAKTLSAQQALRDKEIANHKDSLNRMEAVRAKQLENDKKVLQVEQKSAAIMAKARGVSLTSGQKDAQRGAAAQLALSGTGVRAGDARGAAQAKAQAQRQRAIIQQQIQQGNLDISQKKALMTEDKKLIDTIKKTDAELGRLADQSEKVGEIMGQIDAERAKRETITNLLGDFVRGGPEERKGMNNALLGIQSAVATGTIQNQTPEQRSATFGMLDTLKDIVISGSGGLTGKEVKQELIFRDAIKMGLDPQIAEKLATATSKEEELINSLEKLTKVMEDVAKASAPVDPDAAKRRAENEHMFFAGGGAVYRAGGGNIFKPKGTDTVPAMLTPGEFVVRKSAVDRVGTGTLSAINNGNYARGGVVYRQGGGGIGPGQGNIGPIKMPTGDQFKSMFVDSLSNIGSKKFFRILKQKYGEQEDWWRGKGNEEAAMNTGKAKGDAVKNIATLIKANKLDPQRLSFPDLIATHFDNIRTSGILESINDNEVVFKAVKGLASKASYERMGDNRLRLTLANAQNYLARLGEAHQDYEGGSNNAEIASEVVKQGSGFDVMTKLLSFSDMIADRGRRVKAAIENMKNGEPPFDWKLAVGAEGGALGRGAILGGDPDPKGGGNRERHVGRIQKAIEELQRIGVFRMASGGGVPGTSDTVPAMLTPGEFVMSKSAVQQHGVGYMKSLNRGRIPGFNRGGVVGRGNVQYKHDGGGIGSGGGVLSLDPTRVQEVLTTFNTTFSASLDKIVAPMNGVAQSLSRVAEAFGSMTMTHEFSGHISMSVNIANKDAIIAAVSEGIQPNVSQLITNQVNAAVKEMKQNP